MAALRPKRPLETLVLALPETAGSALYGLVDVLMSTGNLWQMLVRGDAGPSQFHVQIASMSTRSFRCGNGICIDPDV